jgi:hypothetical protein
MVDFGRRPYTCMIRPFIDSDITVKIRWYRALTGAAEMPFPSAFQARDSELDEQADWQRARGEVADDDRPFSRGKPLAGLFGAHICGTEEEWTRGAIYPPDPVEVGPDGERECCAVVGLLWGGSAPPLPITGGLVWGGSAVLEVASGLLWAGSATPGALPAGGLVWGGSAVLGYVGTGGIVWNGTVAASGSGSGSGSGRSFVSMSELPAELAARQSAEPVRTNVSGPRVGVVVGSYRWPELVDLQCHLIRVTCGAVPILISSDHPESDARIAGICAAHGDVTMWPNGVRIGHVGGDIGAFHKGGVWGAGRGLDVVAKVSQRMLITRPLWLQDGAGELLASGLPLSSQLCRGIEHFDLRSELVLLNVSQWSRPEVLERTRTRTYNPDRAGARSGEDFIWRVVVDLLGGRFCPLSLIGEDRYARDSDTLWHCSTPPDEYRAVAAVFGITLPGDFTTDGWSWEDNVGAYNIG